MEPVKLEPTGRVVDFSAELRKCKIRLANHGDVLAIYETLIDALEASDTPYPEPELPYALQAMLDQIAQAFVCVAVNAADDVVGCIVLDTAHWPWNRYQKFLFNQHFWVAPAYRRGGTAVKLLAWAKTRADELGMPLQIELSSLDSTTPEKETFVARQGFKRIGGKFFFDPNQAR